MKYLLRSNSGLSNGSIGYSSKPIGYASTEKECWDFALRKFKTTKFARAPWWTEGSAPLGYEVVEIETSVIQKSPWLKPLKGGAE